MHLRVVRREAEVFRGWVAEAYSAAGRRAGGGGHGAAAFRNRDLEALTT
jgi:hypothetical protein